MKNQDSHRGVEILIIEPKIETAGREHPAIVKQSISTASEALSQINKQPSLEKVPVEAFLPISKIEAILGEKIEHTSVFGLNIDPKDFNQAIERSMSRLALRGVYFPEEMQQFHMSRGFFKGVCSYLKSIGIQELPSANQVRYEGRIGGNLVYDLHLAQTLEDEFYISDIQLTNVKKRENGEFTSLGNGVFDEVLVNIEQYAKAHGYKRLGLVAFMERNMNTFQKRGFEIEESVYGDFGKAHNMSYPMIKKV